MGLCATSDDVRVRGGLMAALLGGRRLLLLLISSLASLRTAASPGPDGGAPDIISVADGEAVRETEVDRDAQHTAEPTGESVGSSTEAERTEDSNNEKLIEGWQQSGDDTPVTMETMENITMVTDPPSAVLEPPTEPSQATPPIRSEFDESLVNSEEPVTIPDQEIGDNGLELEATPTFVVEEMRDGEGEMGEGGEEVNEVGKGEEEMGVSGEDVREGEKEEIGEEVREGEEEKEEIGEDVGEGEEEGDDVPTFTEFSQRRRMEQNTTQRVAAG